MGAVAVGAVLVAVLLVIVAAMVWQEARISPESDPIEYLVDEATGFVYERLSDRALVDLDPDDVRAILEWGIHYNQVIAARGNGSPPVLGSGDAMDYVLERAAAQGRTLDPLDIAEVMAAETEYLEAIGAIGDLADGADSP